MRIATTTAALAFAAALQGCASTVYEERPLDFDRSSGLFAELAEAPPADAGAGLAIRHVAGVPAESARAEAKSWEQGKPTPNSPGIGIDRPAHDLEARPIRDDDIARVLERRIAFPIGARVAALEAESRREWVQVPSWGSTSTSMEVGGFSVRPATPDDADVLRRELGIGAGASCDATPSPIADVGTVPSLFLPNRADLARVRYAAARVGSDVVLVYARATRIHEYRNGLANLYPTLVGLFLPGESTLAIARVEGALVDARTGVVYAVAQGGGRADGQGNVFGTSRERSRKLAEQAEREAIADMAKALRARVAALETAQPKPARKSGA